MLRMTSHEGNTNKAIMRFYLTLIKVSFKNNKRFRECGGRVLEYTAGRNIN